MHPRSPGQKSRELLGDGGADVRPLQGGGRIFQVHVDCSQRVAVRVAATGMPEVVVKWLAHSLSATSCAGPSDFEVSKWFDIFTCVVECLGH
eukprot:8923363-Pyramimonas_sp.AAC.1